MNEFFAVSDLVIKLLFALLCIVFAFMVYAAYVHWHKMSVARYVVRTWQFVPASDAMIDDAIQEAIQDNREAPFMAYIKFVRIKIGHKNVKVGHLLWIYRNLDANITIDQVTEIPLFNKDSSPSTVKV